MLKLLALSSRILSRNNPNCPLPRPVFPVHKPVRRLQLQNINHSLHQLCSQTHRDCVFTGSHESRIQGCPIVLFLPHFITSNLVARAKAVLQWLRLDARKKAPKTAAAISSLTRSHHCSNVPNVANVARFQRDANGKSSKTIYAIMLESGLGIHRYGPRTLMARAWASAHSQTEKRRTEPLVCLLEY